MNLDNTGYLFVSNILNGNLGLYLGNSNTWVRKGNSDIMAVGNSVGVIGNSRMGFTDQSDNFYTSPIDSAFERCGTKCMSLSGATSGTADGTLKLGGLAIKSGSNSRTGSGTLVSGTATIANTSVTANTFILVQDTGGGVLANIGSLYIASQTAGTGFVVTSSNAIDTSTFKYFLFEVN